LWTAPASCLALSLDPAADDQEIVRKWHVWVSHGFLNLVAANAQFAIVVAPSM
jgi:hypothetical protein